mmetsp:Transcript_2414/g.7530  ORF Transcript_2414/g.7530 Transcript_2414/m.7530 type:complete len:249 (-) Transcript_2414:151-897(-)
MASMFRCFACLLLVAALTLAYRRTPGDDAIIVLAGGVGDNGVPHEAVMRRLRRAAELYAAQAAAGSRPGIVCNGGGTTHKPKWVDANGYAVPEAALMGKQLEAMGVRAEDIYVEGYSDDTIGNAFFARVMHIDVRPDWSRLRIITSEFQMKRTQAIYDWVFKELQPLPAQGREVTYDTVDDVGAMPAHALRRRRDKEEASLRAFVSGDLVKLTRLSQLHDFLFRRHSGYTWRGYLSKQRLSGALATSY